MYSQCQNKLRMGFNKRYISKDVLQRRYESGGIKDVMSYMANADALITQDPFSSRVVEIFYDECAENSCWGKIEEMIQNSLGSEEVLVYWT